LRDQKALQSVTSRLKRAKQIDTSYAAFQRKKNRDKTHLAKAMKTARARISKLAALEKAAKGDTVAKAALLHQQADRWLYIADIERNAEAAKKAMHCLLRASPLHENFDATRDQLSAYVLMAVIAAEKAAPALSAYVAKYGPDLGVAALVYRLSRDQPALFAKVTAKPAFKKGLALLDERAKKPWHKLTVADLAVAKAVGDRGLLDRLRGARNYALLRDFTTSAARLDPSSPQRAIEKQLFAP
jgi:hypothetical protein